MVGRADGQERKFHRTVESRAETGNSVPQSHTHTCVGCYSVLAVWIAAQPATAEHGKPVGAKYTLKSSYFQTNIRETK